ncbi:MAG TPA: M48 family metalloprotease [Gammaproteobacteria bacterium]|nr:M48 family metalloprotease [Gammaproteobacteria bacterium]
MKQFGRLFYFLGLLLIAAAHQSCFASNLPDLGNEFRSALPIENERLMGQMMMCEIRAAGLSHPDPLVHEYVRHVGNRLTPYMSMPYGNMQLKFFAINDNSLNAFAFFDGHVAVHSGLIRATETESELAGVMAHELAHISQQHSLRMVADSKRMLPITIAESIAAIAIGVPELILPAWAAHAQKMLNYSRQFEQEADRLGLQILSKANFDPQGLPNMLERLNLEFRFHNKPPEYLLTHPLFESRLSDTRSRANTLLFKQTTSSNMFYLIKARVNVQNASNVDNFIEEQEHILSTQRYKNKLAANYAYGYALLRKGQPDKAWDVFSTLSAAYPDDLIVQITAAEIEMSHNKIKSAMIRMQRLIELYPDSPAVRLQYANFLIHAKQPQLAAKILQKYPTKNMPDPMYYEYVRQTEGMLGNQVAVYEANAEWFVLHGDINSAIKQLDLGMALKNQDPKITTRLKNRQTELTELLTRMKQV